MRYVFVALLFVHVPLAWDWLWLFYPALFLLDSYAPAAYVALGVDYATAVLATVTTLVGGYGLTYYAVTQSERARRVVERLASLRRVNRYVGYAAVAASAVLINFMAAALATWAFRLNFYKALAVYLATVAATAAGLGAAAHVVKDIFA